MKLSNTLARQIYGMTQTEAWDKGVCIKCHQRPPQLPRDATYKQVVADREYRISALCSKCFDDICPDEDD